MTFASACYHHDASLYMEITQQLYELIVMRAVLNMQGTPEMYKQ
jgi:hypothetical protein